MSINVKPYCLTHFLEAIYELSFSIYPWQKYKLFRKTIFSFDIKGTLFFTLRMFSLLVVCVKAAFYDGINVHRRYIVLQIKLDLKIENGLLSRTNNVLKIVEI